MVCSCSLETLPLSDKGADVPNHTKRGGRGTVRWLRLAILFHGRFCFTWVRMLPMKTCSKCRTRKRCAGQRYCRQCRNAYQRAWRPKYPNLSIKQRFRGIVRSTANVYEHRGKLKKRSRCERCGKRRILQKHHKNYAQPIFVEWLCRECHKNEALQTKKRPSLVPELVSPAHST